MVSSLDEGVRTAAAVDTTDAPRDAEAGSGDAPQPDDAEARDAKATVSSLYAGDPGERWSTGTDEGGTAVDDGAAPLSPKKKVVDRVAGGVVAIFPKVEPLQPLNFLCLSVWVAMPTVAYNLLFSDMGFADQVFYALSESYGQYRIALAASLAGFLALLYILDAEHWRSHGTCGALLLYPSILAAALASGLLVLLFTEKHPYIVVCLFSVLNPLWLIGVKLLFYRKTRNQTFVSWLSGPLLFVAVLGTAAWLAWVLADEEHEWNEVTKTEAAVRTGCVPDFETYPSCELADGGTCFSISNETTTIVFPQGCEAMCPRVYGACLNGFLPWVGPLLNGMTLLFLSFCCTFLRTEGTNKKDALNFAKVWIFIVVAMWVTASLAGSTGGVMPALAALTLASFMGVVALVSVCFSPDKHRENVRAVHEQVEKKYGKNFDLARGLFVLAATPLVVVYLGFSVANQGVRRCGVFPSSQPAGDDEAETTDVFTVRTRRHVNVMASWDRTKVYTYAVYWGFAVISIQVIVGKLIVLFLSWLIKATEDVSLEILTGIMCGVAVVMFLIPVVPGIPVYLTNGIVLPAKAYKIMGWPLAILYATGISLVIKLFSCAIQQKGIGENMSGNVKVRQIVGMNSSFMKAMRVILGKRGLSASKVAVLCGGPDWPTSVLCGILKLEVVQITIGTIPVIFMILPTCACGTFVYMAGMTTETGNPKFVWAGVVSAVCNAVTAMVQFAFLMSAIFYVEHTMNEYPEELAAIPIDEEVKAADEKDVAFNKCYEDVTQWKVVPLWPKIMLQASLLCVVASSYTSLLFASRCFEKHTFTDTIEENLEGEWHNIIKPLGWVAIGLFAAAIVFFKIFTSWGMRKAAKLVSGETMSPTVLEIDEDDAHSPLLP